MNVRLFFQLVILESLCMVGAFFALIFFFFLYFGSGAGLSSEKTLFTENISMTVLVLLPLIFGIIKYNTSTEVKKAKSYLYSGLLVTIVSFICSGVLI